MAALRAHGIAKTFHPRVRLDDLLRGRFRASEPPSRALDGVSLQVAEGEILALVGPNGAGKTTLLKILATLVVPDSGEGWVAGRALTDEHAVRRAVGLVTSEERSFYWRLTGRENLTFFGAMQGLGPERVKDRLAEISEIFHLQEFIDRRFDAYSSGMKQRLALARALLHRPRVLLLDEPTRSVDPVESLALRSAIRRVAREEGTAVLLVTHNLREAEVLGDRLAVQRAGKVVFEGTLAALRTGLAGAERYRIALEAPVENWETAPGVSSAELHQNPGAIELDVTLKPEARIGDVVSGLHARGARVVDVRGEGDAIERALERIDTAPREPDRAAALAAPAASPAPALSPPGRSLVQLGAFFRRDLKLNLSYRFAFALTLFGIVLNVGVFFFLAGLVTEARVPALQRYGADFFPFLLVGIAFRGYLSVSLDRFAQALRSEQMMGTLEMLLSCPVRISTLLAASIGFSLLYESAVFAIYLTAGVLLGSVSVARMNLPIAGLVMIPTLVCFAGLGMLSAAFQMRVKRGDPVNFFINAASTFFGGVFFPVEVLPGALQWIARALPVTYALEAIRKTLLAGAGAEGVAAELGVLSGFALILSPLGLFAFSAALRQSRKDGTLGQF
jgi:ABC-type multidrug transport system ATPase subunit/ABC-type multidrug transport system permease subunit